MRARARGVVWCGQAVMYCKMHGDKGAPIDFWWIKPKAAQRDVLELATLNRHHKGAHKNDPGRSRPLYAQFADVFEKAAAPDAAVRGCCCDD